MNYKKRNMKKTLAGALAIPMILGTIPAQMYEVNAQDMENVTYAASVSDLVKDGIVQTDCFVLMNIPYDKYYAADITGNDVEVDAVSSATLNKTRTQSLVNGSYHVNKEGTDITGITFPVKVKAGTDLSDYTQITDNSSVTIAVTNRGQSSETTYTGKDAIFESDSYSFYVLGTESEYYKELNVEGDTLTFSETKGEVTTINDVDAHFITETTYGDYQINIGKITDYVTNGTDAIYGVILHTEEGEDYGMRHLENVWLVNQIAWCTGFTTSVHNCETSSEHYTDMMGQTITGATYYTSKGIYELNLADEVYVPVKTSATVEVEDADVTAGKANIIATDMPADFDAKYSVADLDATVSKENGNLVLSFDKEAAKVGTYTLIITDQSEKYADMSAEFTLTTDSIPVVYDKENGKIAAAEGYKAENVTNYLENISSVKVGDKSYAASGRGAVTIINEDGTIDKDAVSGENAIFEEGKEYTITVTSSGYKNDYTFTYAYSNTAEKETELNKETESNKETVADKETEINKETVTAAETKKEAETTTVSEEKGVKTGDSSNVFKYIALMGAAFVGCIFASKRKEEEIN